jgi:hypothetical protein
MSTRALVGKQATHRRFSLTLPRASLLSSNLTADLALESMSCRLGSCCSFNRSTLPMNHGNAFCLFRVFARNKNSNSSKSPFIEYKLPDRMILRSKPVSLILCNCTLRFIVYAESIAAERRVYAAGATSEKFLSLSVHASKLTTESRATRRKRCSASSQSLKSREAIESRAKFSVIQKKVFLMRFEKRCAA